MASLSDRTCLNVFRSPADLKNYRLITLANGLEALLIQSDQAGRSKSESDNANEPDEEPAALRSASRSRGVSISSCRSRDDDSDSDTESDETSQDGGEAWKNSRHAAACLTVGVGSMADPPELRGLAHYLEHMLFMGSAKYPDENAFEAFLSTHGGYSNGATECETTRYLFEVGPAHLAQALDMFAQFFVAPLLAPDAMERELRAIESEFNRAKHNDYVRLQQVQCETCAPGHPYDSFSWGNEQSLAGIPQADGIDVRACMEQFYREHYSAHLMKLCVYGEDTLDELEKFVVDAFSAVPRRDAAQVRLFDSLPPPFGVQAGQQPTLIKIVPVRKTHQMHLYWTLPPLLMQYRQKPWEYLSHVLGHEGSGSITTLLRDRHWATHVSTGISESDGYEFGSFGSLFEVNVALTRTGLRHWEDVVQIVFDALAFLRGSTGDAKLPAWIFDELRASSDMDFQFQEEQDPVAVCRRLSDIMQDRYGVQRPGDLLHYDMMEGPFDEQETRRLLDMMTPQNTRVLLLSHTFEEDFQINKSVQIERWFGANYTVSTIPQQTVERWSSPSDSDDILALPVPNPFMPQSFEVLPLESDDDLKTTASDAPPEVILTTSLGSKLWYKRDRMFRVPKTNANVLLCLPAVTANVTNYVYAQLHMRAVHDALKQVGYQASIAGHSFGLMVRDLDIELEVAGFSDKVPELVQVVLRALLATRLTDAATFKLLRDELAREYRNVNLKPAAKARYLRLQLLERVAFSVDDKLRALESGQITLEGLVEFQERVLWEGEQPLALRALVHGNISAQDAKQLLLDVESAVSTRAASFNAEERYEPATPLTPARPRTIALPATANGLLLRDVSEHAEETNSMVEVYFQLGQLNVQDRAYAELLQQLMAEPLFHELRTTQQLGYEVHCCVRDTHGVVGFSIAVQSASHAAGEIAVRIDRFMGGQFLSYLADMLPKAEELDGTFARHVTALQRSKSRADATLSDETDRYWEEIQCRRYAFALESEIASALGTCSIDGLVARYRRWLLPSGSSPNGDGERRLLRVHIVGQQSPILPLEQLVGEDEVPHVIDDLRAYKRVLRCHC